MVYLLLIVFFFWGGGGVMGEFRDVWAECSGASSGWALEVRTLGSLCRGLGSRALLSSPFRV